jgi:hypothetical protein
MLDPPDHTRLRNLVNKAFTRRAVEGLRPRIQGVVDDLLDRVEPSGEMELVHDFASPLPITVIAEMLGVPSEDRAALKRWSDDLTALLDPFNAPRGLEGAQEAFAEIGAYFRRVFDERRRDPRDDLLSRLVAVEDEGDTLSEPELLSLCTLILGAGHETTTNLIGNAVVALLRNPGERKRLRDDPGLIRTAVEEFLRYDSPVQLTDRVATRDCEIGGKPGSRGLRGSRSPRRRARPESPHRLRPGRALLPGGTARAGRGGDRSRHVARALPGSRGWPGPPRLAALDGPARSDVPAPHPALSAVAGRGAR